LWEWMSSRPKRSLSLPDSTRLAHSRSSFLGLSCKCTVCISFSLLQNHVQHPVY
jgi:hypothetical protein